MLFLQKIPKLLRWIFSVLLILLVVMTLSRLIIYWSFNPPGKAFSGSAFIMGFRYDARVLSIIGLAIMLLCAIPYLNPFKNYSAKKIWNFLITLIFMIMVLVLAIDYYHFDYLHQRLNATVLNYLQDAGISINMMWQSYPLFTITLVALILLFLAKFVFGRLLAYYQQQYNFDKRKRSLHYVIAFFFFGIFIFGKIGQFPLRWSDAYTLSDDFKANLALNPFQSFLSTLNFRNSTFDIKKVRADYHLMANYLQVNNPDSVNLNFKRTYSVTDSTGNKPNIVLVICESFSAYKSSMYNNPLNTTPYFNELCKNGIFFDRCFTPAYGTARGVWATITGIPDVESPKTASRNPNAVDQQTIINSFTGYNNFYFLGGSATWANIRGVLTNNINNLKLYEQDDYTAKKIDVWGISDKNLFLEANKVLRQQINPFFAIIQTADNHRPYTIPEEDRNDFKLKTFSEDSLKRFGFESNEEMNAFRYTDFCYQKFMEAAQSESYFKNTIFVFVGDHGIRYNGTLDYFPKAWTEQGLTCEHVPLLFYAPGLLKPQKIHDIASQVDILPTIASLANISYSNNSLGRNLFDTAAYIKNGLALPKEKYAFVIDHDVKTVGLVGNKYYYLKNLKTGKVDFVSMTGNEPIPMKTETDSIKGYMQKLTDAFYQTAQYLLLNNKK
ncbi:MAG TPA: sulfatase-like hydrolase/transferase [Ferruginibacter sp.]|nr:sulfatase-like hydrolase/transferase [Ferruginibacter sp.]